MRIGIVAGLIVTLAVAIVTAVGVSAIQPEQDPPFLTEHSAYDPQSVTEFSEFDLYNLGESFEGMPLTAITRRHDTERSPEVPAYLDLMLANFVGFHYGDCEVIHDTGCAPPLQVQIWPACARNLSSYSLTPAGEPLPHERLTIRGAPAALFDDRLEVYTGETTVAIFGFDRDQLLRAGTALRGVNVALETHESLPEPAPGALEGGLACGT